MEEEMLAKLAIVTTHPIQYNAPIFKILNSRGKVHIKVFYTWEQSKDEVYDPDFKRAIKWDIPLLDGYDFSFVKNIAKDPGSHHFRGIHNPSLIDEIIDFKPDGILVFGWSFISHLKVMRFFRGKVPVFFRGDSTLLDDVPGVRSWLRNQALRWVYRKVDKAFYVGKKSKEYYIKNGLRENKLIFAPHAIDNQRFECAVKKGGEFDLREKFKISRSELVFLFAGKLEPRKNPILLIDSFKFHGIKNVHLVIVGNGILEEEVKRRAGSFPYIHFLDFQNQLSMPSIYASSDVLVLPSRSETWGLAVNEAMACGKAVLVSDKCGCAEDLVEEGKNGFVFESENLADLKSKLLYFSEKPREEIEEMGKASFHKIQDWSFEKVAESIENALLK